MPQVSRLAAGRTVATLSVWAAGWAAANAQRLGCGVSSGKRSRFGLQGGQYSGQQLRQRAALGFFFPYRWAAANARRLGCGVGSGKRSRFGLQGEMRCRHQRGCWHTEAEALESGVGREGRAMALEWGEKEFGQERGTGLGMNLLCNLSLI